MPPVYNKSHIGLTSFLPTPRTGISGKESSFPFITKGKTDMDALTAVEIRKSRTSTVDLAAEYGVSYCTIANIRSGRSWSRPDAVAGAARPEGRPLKDAEPIWLCACGCREIVNPGKTWVLGHHRRSIIDKKSKNHNKPLSGAERLGRWLANSISTPHPDLETPCLLSGGHVHKTTGYSYTTYAGHSMTRHRAAYLIVHDLTPADIAGQVVDHLCSRRSCLNSDHLELVTSAENSRRGVLTKLTEQEARSIKFDLVPATEAAERYGVTVKHVEAIRSGRRWNDLEYVSPNQLNTAVDTEKLV